MNNSFVLWASVAIAVGVGLFLLLVPAETVTAPELEETAVVVGEEAAAVVEEAASGASETVYWTAVDAGSECVPRVRCASHVAAARAGYGVVHVAPVARVAPTTLIGGCGTPVTPCARPACPVCVAPRATCPRPEPTYVVGRCGELIEADTPPRDLPLHVCRPHCAQPCGPCVGINRNGPTCIAECSFVQLHSTARHPICSAIRFEWTASKGSFLDPSACDPIYYAPVTLLPCGEDVRITLTVTDGYCSRYTDEIRLHIRNRP
jgi:hypothetical protein